MLAKFNDFDFVVAVYEQDMLPQLIALNKGDRLDDQEGHKIFRFPTYQRALDYFNLVIIQKSGAELNFHFNLTKRVQQ